MGGIGNQASIESADIVLLNDRPHQLVEAFTISRQTGNMVNTKHRSCFGNKSINYDSGDFRNSWTLGSSFRRCGCHYFSDIQFLAIAKIQSRYLTKTFLCD